jgi:hypothetical protein
MIEKYEPEQALSEHSKGPALADLMSGLERKLSSDLDRRSSYRTPPGTRRRAR